MPTSPAPPLIARRKADSLNDSGPPTLKLLDVLDCEGVAPGRWVAWFTVPFTVLGLIWLVSFRLRFANLLVCKDKETLFERIVLAALHLDQHPRNPEHPDAYPNVSG